MSATNRTRTDAPLSPAQRAWRTRRAEEIHGGLQIDNDVEKVVVRVARSALARARAKGMDYDATLPRSILERARRNQFVCELSGVAFRMDRVGYGAAPRPFAPSIDRIDPHGGYTVENTRLVCWAMNCFLGTWGEEVALELAAAFVENANEKEELRR